MKKLISDNSGFKTFAEVRACAQPADLVQLRFLTEWEQAKAPTEQRVLCEMLLTTEQLQTLKEFL